MVSKFRGVLVAVAAGAMMVMSVGSMAQTGNGPPRGMGMGGPMDKAGMMQRMGLDDPALNLTADQKTKIDKLLDGFMAEQSKMREQMQSGSPPSQEAMTAMRATREKLNTDIGAVLNPAQKKTWEATMAARRPAGPPGMGGPPRQ